MHFIEGVGWFTWSSCGFSVINFPLSNVRAQSIISTILLWKSLESFTWSVTLCDSNLVSREVLFNLYVYLKQWSPKGNPYVNHHIWPHLRVTNDLAEWLLSSPSIKSWSEIRGRNNLFCNVQVKPDFSNVLRGINYDNLQHFFGFCLISDVHMFKFALICENYNVSQCRLSGYSSSALSRS